MPGREDMLIPNLAYPGATLKLAIPDDRAFGPGAGVQ